jgi:iron complex transport system ATP-binding protein
MAAVNDILSTQSLAVGYHNGKQENCVLCDLQLTLRQGELVCLLGSNGIGKSTLLRTLSGVQRPLSGKVMLNGRDLADYTKRQLSQLISIVYTDRTLAGALTVRELVSLGRHPYTGFFGRLDSDDEQVVTDAMTTMGIAHKAGCHVATLSDGERQKAMIARALAQETPIILLDEPTAFLDVASRIETMKCLHRLAVDKNKAILLSSHDVSQSLALANRLWLLRSDHKMVQGVTEDLVLGGQLDRLFDGRQVQFDSMVGDFVALADVRQSVALDCADELLRHWVANALAREGYAVAADATIKITAKSSTEIIVDNIAVNSISALIRHLSAMA